MRIDWDEMLMVRVSAGKVSTWTANRPALSAFNDPGTWSDPGTWENHFLAIRPPASVTTRTGAGVLLVDMDARRMLNLSDFTEPTELRFPEASAASTLVSPSALAGLLAHKDQWQHAVLELLPNPNLLACLWEILFRRGTQDSARARAIRITLADFLEGTPAPGVHTLTSRQGVVHWRARKYLLLGGTYLPPGWTLEAPRSGREISAGLSTVNAVLRAAWPVRPVPDAPRPPAAACGARPVGTGQDHA